MDNSTSDGSSNQISAETSADDDPLPVEIRQFDTLFELVQPKIQQDVFDPSENASSPLELESEHEHPLFRRGQTRENFSWPKKYFSF